MLVVASILVLATTTVLAVIGAFHTGITTDEPIHVMRLRNYFHTGWYALDWDYRGDGPGSAGTNTFVYGPVAMLILHGWSMLWGVEGWGHVSTTPHAYDIRHVGVVVIGLIGVGAVAAMGRVLLRSWRWGLVAAAALSAIPMWTGHEMFNVKDVPVATGYTLATLALLLYVRYDDSAPRAGLRLGRAALLTLGLVLSLGTRPGMWPGLLAVGVIAVAGIVLASSARRTAIVVIVELVGACVVSAGALVAIYPKLFGSPLKALPQTSESSSSFLNGLKSDRLYVPRHTVEEMPTLLLIFVTTGAIIGLIVLLKHWRTDPVPAARIALIGVQTATLPIVAMILGSDLYHGLRQLLFAAPAAAMLAAYGMAWALGRSRERPLGAGRLVLGPRVLAVLATAAVLLPAIDQITLQPFQTTYVNLATDLITSPSHTPQTRYGSDFWRVSIPDLVKGVDVKNQLLCKAIVDPVSGVAYRFVNGGTYSTTRSLDCRDEPSGPLKPQHLPVASGAGSTFDAVFIAAVPPNCTELRSVNRRRHGFTIALTVLARCTEKPSPLGTDEIDTASPVLGTAAQGDLWRYTVDGWQQWPGSKDLTGPVPQAVVAFVPDRSCTVSGCDLVLHGTGPSDLLASIDGASEPVVIDDSTLRVRLTATQAQTPGGVWVTLSRPSGADLDTTITGLSLTAAPTTEGH
jgi:hypothetical protein